MESTGWLFHPLFPGRIGIWKCWFLWREENRSSRRKTLGAGTRTNNKLNPHMTPRPGIEPRSHWWEASALTTAPSLLPHIPYTFYIPYCRTNLRKLSIRFQGPTLFKSLSHEIQNSESISLAKDLENSFFLS